MNHGLKLHPDGTLEITMPKDKEVTRVLVCQAGTQNGKLYYPEINRETKMIAQIKISKEDMQSAVDEAVEKIREEMAEPERKGKWTTEEVAEILFNAFGDDCACNFNGIDEWLPERCKYTQIADECPEPKEKHGCWMQFLLQGGADIRGEQE